MAFLPHEERVIEEYQDLDEKVDKLTTFISKGKPSFISNEEWLRLVTQLAYMKPYLGVLKERTDNFKEIA